MEWDWKCLEEKYVNLYYKNDLYYRLLNAYDEIVGKSRSTQTQNFNNDAYDTLLLLTEACNMNCKYCFEHHNKSKCGNMDKETVIKSLEFINNIGHDTNLSLFGGEPTINVGAFETIADWISKNELKSIVYCKITTNGYDVDQRVISSLKKINEYIPLDITVSMDGNQETHDAARVDHKGNGTYVTIINNIKKLRDSLPNVYIVTQSTLTSYNIHQWKDILFNCKNLKGLSNLHFVNLDDPDMSDNEHTLTKEDFRPIFEYYYNYMVGVEDLFDISFTNMFDNAICDPFRSRIVSICGAGWKAFGIRPNGDVIPCHKYIDSRNQSSKFKLGNVHIGVTIPERYVDLNKKILADGAVHNQSGRDCTQCVLKENCKGCTASNEIISGDIMIKSDKVCERTKMLAELALEYREPWLDKEISKLTKFLESYLRDNNVQY